jgi:formylglycine-generating enzyme required for sulfatase activity
MSNYRVIRGGSYLIVTRLLRASHLIWDEPEGRSGYGGFRIVVIRKKP